MDLQPGELEELETSNFTSTGPMRQTKVFCEVHLSLYKLNVKETFMLLLH